MNRRNFLKVALAASVAPTMIVDAVLADDDNTQEDDDEDP